MGDYQADIGKLLALQGINGGEYWATPDGNISKGGALSTVECSIVIAELLDADPAGDARGIARGAAETIFRCMRDDGRIRTIPAGAIYPCHTAGAARALCALGFSQDGRMGKTYGHFLETQYPDGGWRCNSSKFGKGPETLSSNPGPTLGILDIFRHTDYVNAERKLDQAVAFLLDHWESRRPLGPCHYGIGSLFMKLEYPMLRYNLFTYVYVLSFYRAARKDRRFIEAFNVLTSKLVDGMVVIENQNKKLAELDFCRIHEKSALATRRYGEIVGNLRIG